MTEIMRSHFYIRKKATLKYLTSKRSAPDSAEELIIQSGSPFESAKKNNNNNYKIIKLLFFYIIYLKCVYRFTNINQFGNTF